MKSTYKANQNFKQKPKWLKANIPTGKNVHLLKEKLSEKKLATVCEEAKCPNLGECWQNKTATIMILGDTCTRACEFCHVKTGNPQGYLDPNEIKHSVEVAQLMDLEYIVITSVDRDDLIDGGANHFAQTVEAIKQHSPKTSVEVLIPDFGAIEWKMQRLLNSRPLVIAQNMETVKRLTWPVRDRRASYQKTLKALQYYKVMGESTFTKTSLMVGFGETMDEIKSTLHDLRQIDVDIITFGQYLRPSLRHLPVTKYYHPDEFELLKDLAYQFEFKFVASGPMVRSSYKAKDFFDFLKENKQ